MGNIMVLEWTKKQNAFHIQSMEVCAEKNLNALLDNQSSDYIPIYFGTDDECRVVASRWRRKLQQREQKRMRAVV